MMVRVRVRVGEKQETTPTDRMTGGARRGAARGLNIFLDLGVELGHAKVYRSALKGLKPRFAGPIATLNPMWQPRPASSLTS
jgi:hypothetical protein